MAAEQTGPTGPDLKKGVAAAQVPDGASLAGQVDGEAVLLAHRGSEWFAIGATCSHYGGPLAEGLIVGDTVRCPWHHACFSLRTGTPIRPPALNDLSCWRVEVRDGKVFVGDKIEAPSTVSRGSPARGPSSVLIIGAGAAGNSVSETLRREGYSGPITMVDPDPSAPCDRPNLSKDYLAGNAPEDWIPLHPPDFYRDRNIELLRGRVAALEPKADRVRLESGETRAYGALVLATGASPVRLPELESGNPRVHYLRSLVDSRAIIAAAEGSRRAVVLGASFIGLEVAASLRARKLEVHIVAPESRPLEGVMGPELGNFIRQLHEEHGVIFHLGQTAKQVAGGQVILKNGERLAADLVVAGVGVRPNLDLAEAAGLTLDRGLVVNERLETSAPRIYAAGDIARWPDPHTGDRIRVEHWVVAERQGQTVARNILGRAERFDAVPFFWSQHYDVPINYVGHAAKWDAIDVEGDIGARDGTVRFRRGSKTLAVATIYRDRQSLEAELDMEQAVR
ncbi:MAG TPA: FAD-dependent oxidoreductase [Gemmatimonadales bacterium]|jgi:NADPH-dependent 2,4-dienoyl-CoA reductase/sulfur reductase-like enzyme/nitrite reductase/ring-hydroxylating ferredoxin subunit